MEYCGRNIAYFRTTPTIGTSHGTPSYSARGRRTGSATPTSKVRLTLKCNAHWEEECCKRVSQMIWFRHTWPTCLFNRGETKNRKFLSSHVHDMNWNSIMLSSDNFVHFCCCFFSYVTEQLTTSQLFRVSRDYRVAFSLTTWCHRSWM